LSNIARITPREHYLITDEDGNVIREETYAWNTLQLKVSPLGN
jgi:hypothetical protein